MWAELDKISKGECKRLAPVGGDVELSSDQGTFSVDESLHANSMPDTYEPRKQFGVKESTDYLVRKVDMYEGAGLVMNQIAAKRKKEIIEKHEILEWQMKNVDEGNKRLEKLSKVVTVGVGLFAALEVLRVSLSAWHWVSNRIKESRGQEAAQDEVEAGYFNQERQESERRLHARQWNLGARSTGESRKNIEQRVTAVLVPV